MSQRVPGERSLYIRIYKHCFEMKQPMSFRTLCATVGFEDLRARAGKSEGDALRLWFHSNFMTPLWAHMQFGGSGSPGLGTLADRDGDAGYLSGEAVMTYLSFVEFQKAHESADKARIEANRALWAAALSLFLAGGFGIYQSIKAWQEVDWAEKSFNQQRLQTTSTETPAQGLDSLNRRLGNTAADSAGNKMNEGVTRVKTCAH